VAECQNYYLIIAIMPWVANNNKEIHQCFPQNPEMINAGYFTGQVKRQAGTSQVMISQQRSVALLISCSFLGRH